MRELFGRNTCKNKRIGSGWWEGEAASRQVLSVDLPLIYILQGSRLGCNMDMVQPFDERYPEVTLFLCVEFPLYRQTDRQANQCTLKTIIYKTIFFYTKTMVEWQ